jgi:hypothetical protein
MSRLFGPLRQMGYVVPDVEAAMKHWVEVCGVGPWFYADRLPLTSFSYGGKRYDDIHLSIALANSGEMQIELIQQRSDHPSMGRAFLVANPKGGLQHWSSWPENYDEIYQRALANGYVVAQEGDAPADASYTSATKGTPARSSRWRTRRRCAGASSTRCAKRR